jgi:hypothetical protein
VLVLILLAEGLVRLPTVQVGEARGISLDDFLDLSHLRGSYYVLVVKLNEFVPKAMRL